MVKLTLAEYMALNRKPTKAEERLIDFLINQSSKKFLSDWKDKITVRQMNDGGMGGLVLFLDNESEQNRLFGEQISEYYFKDKDGIDVIVSLNTDNKGNLFELDVWKTDFSKLLKFPDL
jgi:hypothetical protein